MIFIFVYNITAYDMKIRYLLGGDSSLSIFQPNGKFSCEICYSKITYLCLTKEKSKLFIHTWIITSIC